MAFNPDRQVHLPFPTQGIATVAAVDCDAEANKQLCGRYEIRGFPTIKVFPGDKSKGGNKTPTDYQGRVPAVGGLSYSSAWPGTYRETGRANIPAQSPCLSAVERILPCGAGPRSAKGIADAVTAGLHARLIQHPKDAAAFEEFRGHSALPKVILFTDKARSTVRSMCLPYCRASAALRAAASSRVLLQPEQHAALQHLQCRMEWHLQHCRHRED